MPDRPLTMDGLASRMERLETLTGVLRWMVVALVVAIVAAALFFFVQARGQSNKTVGAERLFLRNAAGDNIAVLGSDADGMPSLALLDARKKLRLLVYLQRDGLPGLSMLDQQSRNRATLSLNRDGAPSLVLFDEKKNLRGLFGLDTSSAAVAQLFSSAGGLTLNGSNGTVQWKAAGGSAQEIPVQK